MFHPSVSDGLEDSHHLKKGTKEYIQQELDVLNEMHFDLLLEVGRWVEFKEGNPVPDYDEYVLWAFEDGTCIWDALDKDGNTHIYGGEINGNVYKRATHYRKIMTPMECEETFNIK